MNINFHNLSNNEKNTKELGQSKSNKKINQVLERFDDGELFVEEVFSENILFDDNKIKNASYDQDKGFGVRAVENDEVNFTHNSQLTDDAINTAVSNLKSKIKQPEKIEKIESFKSNSSLYTNINPIEIISLSEKSASLKKLINMLVV